MKKIRKLRKKDIQKKTYINKTKLKLKNIYKNIKYCK